MDIAVLGTGVVGRTLGSRLVGLGHTVTMGSREAGNPTALEWAAGAGAGAGAGSFADAAAAAGFVINATPGTVSLDALTAAGAANLAGKVLLDLSNPLDASQGMPPILAVCNTDSVGEQIQRTFPDARVVKSLNTVNCDVMVNPAIVPGPHTMFVAGNEAGAKAEVTDLLASFGWPRESILDLGDIAGSRGMEMYLPLWLRLWGATGTGHLNIGVQREN